MSTIRVRFRDGAPEAQCNDCRYWWALTLEHWAPMHQARCRACIREDARIREAEYRKNPEVGAVKRMKGRLYYAANKDRMLPATHRWRERNRDHIREYNEQYRREHKQEILAKTREYYAANKEKIRAKARERYMRKKLEAATGTPIGLLP